MSGLDRQPDFFSPEVQGRLARNRGMALAAAAQNRVAPEWADLAFAAIYSIAQRQETVHADDIHRSFHVEPSHYNAWGAVWQRAIREGVIERTGTVRQCTVHPHKHAHNSPVYRSLIFGVR